MSMIGRFPDSTVRERIRLRLPGAQRAMFNDVMAWEDEIVAALNLVAAAADGMAEALEEIELLMATAHASGPAPGDLAAIDKALGLARSAKSLPRAHLRGALDA